ncbi:MAG: hypothetical protein WC341_10700 [Bacteroidales bacterium]|jgi:hypothetical protein
MKIIAELKKRKIPIVRIDKSLNKYDDIVLFPDKLEKANKMLGKVGLPKQWTDSTKDSNSYTETTASGGQQ